MSDIERRDRLAFAIRAAMGKRSAQTIADAMVPRRSKETVSRWARGETVPSALDVGPLAIALGVKALLLVDPPALPSYPLDEYLLTPEGQAHAAEAKAFGDKQAEASTPSPRPKRTRTG